MSLSRRVERNAATQIAGRLFTSALAFVITAVVLPRQLGQHDFGIFAFYLSLHQLLQNVFDFGAGTVVIRDASRERERAGQLIGMLVQIKAVIAGIALVGMVGVAWVYEGPGERFLLLGLAALSLLFHAPAGAAAIFNVDMAFGRSVLASVAGQSAWLLATLALALSGVAGPALYLVAFGLGTVVNGVLAYAWARRRVAIRYDAGRADFARLWREAWPAGVSMTMASVYFFIDTAMLRPLAGEVAVARYSVAYRLMTFVLMVPVLFSNVLFPVYSRLWSLGAAALRPFFQRSLGVLLALGLIVPATVPLVSPDIMALVYEPQYGGSAPVLSVLCLAIATVFATYPHVLVLLASGQQRVMMFISTGGALLNVGSNLWAIPRFGIEGAAWTTVGTEGFVLLAAAVMAARRTGVHVALSGLLRPVACAALAHVVLTFMLPPMAGLEPAWRVGAAVVVALGAVLVAGVFPLDLGTEEGAPLDRAPRPGAPA